MPRPVKHRLTGYAEIEERVTAVIEQALGVPKLTEAEQRSVREIDDALLYYEFMNLAGSKVFPEAPPIAMAHDYSLRDMAAVEAQFIALYQELSR